MLAVPARRSEHLSHRGPTSPCRSYESRPSVWLEADASAVARSRLPGRGLSLRVLIPETGPVTERLRVREIDDDEGQRLVRIVRRGTGSVVTWRRAQMVLLSAQGMDVPVIAKVAFTSEDRVRE